MKKKTISITLGVLGLAVLAGAAFLAPRLFNSNAAKQGQYSEGVAGPAGGKGKPRMPVETVLPAEGQPKSSPELSGTVNSVKDNSIFVEPSDYMGVMQPNGKEMEVVVTKDTKIYLYAGMQTISEAKDGQSAVTQTKLDPITINDLVENDILSIWGNKRGDRFIADVIQVLH
jgi:hypothetical protein